MSQDEPDVGAGPTTDAATKARLRREVLVRRAAVPAPARLRRDRAILGHLAGIVSAGMVVCAYVPDDDEAGGRDLPEELARRGARVLLPVSPARGPVEWATYAGPADLVRGRFGILVPSAPPEGPELIADADLVLVPAVAVDRSGTRLGRGGGYYDRSLALAGPRARLLALADTENVLEHIPAETHDRPVHGVITPEGLLDFGTWHSPE
ncbi:5-formyltetrahydrofolate cyclo-ligase [Dietzia cinnamea]|uniref:5-formyltetrahydrofolate cyclo-ligase n=1 Tax=Dietzia cinnamea TaxID=321318 RepID=UPI0007BC0914|nr:5-formyltetrahydrofolate cyclo-ligase [Dietzia cinnamea]KZO60039.1 5-formyltetrahydrofolate cyclo-ligase [Dietzia maris]MCT2058415.1 5-formyltetrahydrofolate cyclo-ligase [Dietzia cinnamea]MCT2098440.1 5-formyltetrahydrofolate cyclo-ligase [Dietzia cinnamea]MCT2138874.1 5-formyltetrahydrofolate cyclo-ligase [Dietzia cinnamea]